MPSTSYGQPPPNGPSYFQPSSTSHSHVTAPFMPGTQPMGGGAMNAPPGHMHTGNNIFQHGQQYFVYNCM